MRWSVVDASGSGIDIARAVHGARAEFVCAPIDAKLVFRLGRARFDVVVSSDVIEHLYQPRLLVACAREVLIPGGWLVIGAPYHGYLKNLALSLLNRWDAHHETHSEGGHIKFFSENTLGQLLRMEGFAHLRFFRYGRFPYLWKHMICVARAPGQRRAGMSAGPQAPVPVTAMVFTLDEELHLPACLDSPALVR